MKKHFFLAVLLTGFFHFAQAQKCLKPTPMTADQVQKVTGKWKGVYTNLNGEKTDIEINISAKANNEVECEINNPPLAGKETSVEYFFCPGGEFHLRKFVGDNSFVFQASPENNTMAGIVSMYDSKSNRKMLGRFSISKE